MAARISAPRIWVRLRFTAVNVAQSGGKRKIEKGKLKIGDGNVKRAGETPAVRRAGLARVH